MLDLRSYKRIIDSINDFIINTPKDDGTIKFSYPANLHMLFNNKLDSSKFERKSFSEEIYDRRVNLEPQIFFAHRKLSYLLVNTMNITPKKDFDKIDFAGFAAKRLQLYLSERATYRNIFNNFYGFIDYFLTGDGLRPLFHFFRFELMYELDSFIKVETSIFYQLKPSAFEYYQDNDPKFVALNYLEEAYYTDLYSFYDLVSTFCSFVMPSLVSFNKLFLRIKTNVWYFDLDPSFVIFKKISINVVIFMIFFL